MSGQSQAEPRRWTLRGARLERVTAERIEPRDQLEALERVEVREDRATRADIEAIILASYNDQPQLKHDGSGEPKTFEECYGCKPLEHTESVHDAQIALAAVFSEVEDA